MTDSSRTRRPLGALLGAVGVSGAGTRMSFLAIPWFVLSTTGSATLTGLVAFAEMGPYVGVQVLGGPAVDRIGAKRISVVTDATAAMCFATVVALHAAGHLPLVALALLVAAGGAVRGAGDAARDVLVPGVTELAGTTLERSSGLYDGVSRLSTLVALPLAGVLVTLFSAVNVLGIDAGTFVVSAVVVAFGVPTSAQPPPAPVDDAPVSYRASLVEGLRHLGRDRLLLGIALMVLVTNFVDQAGSAVLFPVWAHDVLHSSIALGAYGGAFSFGAVAGNALTTWLAPRLPRRLTYAVGFLVAGAPRYFVGAFATTLAPVLVVSFIGGLGAGGINPIVGAVEYERVPRHLQARVLGTVGALAWAGIPFGSLAGGVLASGAGLSAAMLAAGSLYLVTTLAPFVFPVWRSMDRRDPSQAAVMEPASSD